MWSVRRRFGALSKLDIGPNLMNWVSLSVPYRSVSQLLESLISVSETTLGVGEDTEDSVAVWWMKATYGLMPPRRVKNIPFSISKKLTEAFSVLDGSKEPKWNSAHCTLIAFPYFRFPEIFWSTEILRFFCHPNNSWGNTELENAFTSHCRTHHTESHDIFRFSRSITKFLESCLRMWCLPTA